MIKFRSKILSKKFLNYTILKQCYCNSNKNEKCSVEDKYKSVVGLEIHAQMNTNSKLFSGAATNFNAPVNTNVSLFDAAIPGTMPVLNRACVEVAVKTALALNCDINPVSVFERKHYYYADLPFGFQITQHRRPIASNGKLDFDVCTGKGEYYSTTSILKQLQIEQDSGKMLHEDERSLIDLNRAGVPLMELVFEPDLENGVEAAALVKELCLILCTINTSTCKMEEGALRVDANVSVQEVNGPPGCRAEIKNIGSIKGVCDAITFEINRQMNLIKNNRQSEIINETRAWDAIQKETVPMRVKETKYDYRYVLEPNLPPIHLHMPGTPKLLDNMISVEDIKNGLPKLPKQMRMELCEVYGLPATSAQILVNENVLYNHFMNIINDGDRKPSMVTNILTMELLTMLNKENKKLTDEVISSESLGDLVDLYADGSINLTTVRSVLNEIICGNNDDPKTIVNKNNWSQINEDSEIESMCIIVLQDNENLVKQYKAGKKKVFKALLGCLAKTSENRINMAKGTRILESLLKK